MDYYRKRDKQRKDQTVQWLLTKREEPPTMHALFCVNDVYTLVWEYARDIEWDTQISHASDEDCSILQNYHIEPNVQFVRDSAQAGQFHKLMLLYSSHVRPKLAKKDVKHWFVWAGVHDHDASLTMIRDWNMLSCDDFSNGDVTFLLQHCAQFCVWFMYTIDILPRHSISIADFDFLCSRGKREASLLVAFLLKHLELFESQLKIQDVVRAYHIACRYGSLHVATRLFKHPAKHLRRKGEMTKEYYLTLSKVLANNCKQDILEYLFMECPFQAKEIKPLVSLLDTCSQYGAKRRLRFLWIHNLITASDVADQFDNLCFANAYRKRKPDAIALLQEIRAHKTRCI